MNVRCSGLVPDERERRRAPRGGLMRRSISRTCFSSSSVSLNMSSVMARSMARYLAAFSRKGRNRPARTLLPALRGGWCPLLITVFLNCNRNSLLYEGERRG
jgi:hypothetical protein